MNKTKEKFAEYRIANKKVGFSHFWDTGSPWKTGNESRDGTCCYGNTTRNEDVVFIIEARIISELST
jgi:hypothetical protein